MAGGTQLKKLKESLRNAGLTGQSNFSKKGKGKNRKNGAQDKLRKDERQKVLSEIREQFNPFDQKVTRNKGADALEKKLTVGKPGITKQAGEEARRKEYESRLARKGKVGGILDRRFGEGNSKLTPEEKMLERFTKERLAKASKSSMYNLEDGDNIDDDENGGFTELTHLGQSLSGKISDTKHSIDDDDFFSRKRSGDSIGNEEGSTDEPVKKKTKAEVMKEVIAKSKRYKHERQKAHMENMEKVDELDDEFENVMDDLSVANKGKEDNNSKSKFDLEYEMKVSEAKLDKRAKPTDRTKTEEEIRKEEEERKAEHEKKRLQRMEGEEDDDENRANGAVADDLGDDFWADSGDEETGFSVGSPVESVSSDDQSEQEVESDNEESKRPVKDGSVNIIKIGNKTVVVAPKVSRAKLTCPQTLAEFKSQITEDDFESTVSTIKKVFETYQPKLAEGNKEKLGVYSTVLFEYLLEISNKSIGAEDSQYVRLMDFLTRTICNLTEKYQEVFLEAFRKHILNAHERLLSQDPSQFPLQSDAVLLTLIGRTFSTSDKFHLVVIPALLVAGEALEFMAPEENKTQMFFGVYLCDLLMQYERISNRVVPEVISFLQRILLSTIPCPQELEEWGEVLVCSAPPSPTKYTQSTPCEIPSSAEKLSISKMWALSKSPEKDDEETFLKLIIFKSVKTLDLIISRMFKNTTAAPELTSSFIPLIRHLIKHTATPNTAIINVATKLANIHRISTKERRPLKLQKHRAIGIAQITPRFNENFNPERKSSRTVDMDPMDPVAVREEISKLKHQVKEERKQALKELRRDTKFEARAQISRKKKEYEDYHSKMARIYNSIQTEEGTAKNEYEKEKKARKNKK